MESITSLGLVDLPLLVSEPANDNAKAPDPVPPDTVFPLKAGQVTFPEHIALANGTLVSLLDVARAVAEDEHPGDDAVGPRHLLNSAREGVKLRRLSKAIEQAGGSLHLTPANAWDFVDMYGDELQCLGNCGLDEALPSRHGHGINPVREGNAALIMVVGVLMFEARKHWEAARSRKARKRAPRVVERSAE